ncbi:MAG: M48 family metalloprotease, partial [Pseudomonadota bacterium]
GACYRISRSALRRRGPRSGFSVGLGEHYARQPLLNAETGSGTAPAQGGSGDPVAGASASGDTSLEARRTTYLSALTARLANRMHLPEDMQIHLHYVDEPLVNAFATLGGHIFVYQGLIDAIHSENALALVIGHEIGHVRARHPIVAAGRGLTVSLALGSLFGLTDNGAVQGLVNWLGVTSTLSFSRAQELEADELAAAAVVDVYGHLEGAGEVFEAFARESEGLRPPELLSTHPHPADRALRLRDRASELGISGSLTPLPLGLFSAASETE